MSRQRAASHQSALGQSGFTVPELLVVIAFLVVLATISAIMLRPTSYDTANTYAERRSLAASIVVALTKYHADTKTWPASLSTIPQKIGNDEGLINLCSDLVPKYLKDIPLDPVAGAKLTADGQEISTDPCTEDVIYDSGYAVALSGDGAHVTVSAPAILHYKELAITK